MNIEFREKLITTLCAASLFSLTLFLFGPLYLYFTNISEFPYYILDVWYLFASISLVCILLISAILLPLKKSLYQKAVSLLFAVAVLLWIQGNILVWNYGLLNGREIEWNNYKVFGYIDTSVWLVIITFAFIKSSLVYNLIKKISLGLILIQIASVSIACFQAPKQPDWKMYSLSEDSKYDFSPDKNVIILVLDTFQTDIFMELINEYPDLRGTFEGFTYFRNAVGGFPTTELSIPLILTGRSYDNSVPLETFKKNAYLSSIPYILKQNSFQVNLYTDKNFIYCNENIASNIIQKRELVSNKDIIANMYNITLFRYVPHFIKKDFNVVNGLTKELNLTNGDLDFAQKIVTQPNTKSEKYTFKFYHLWGTHPPFSLNSNLEPTKLEFNRNGYKTQAKAALEITKRFLASLKNIGIYDNSMIFIVGDHGAGVAGSFGLNTEASGYKEENSSSNIISDNTITSGLPLILVKTFNSNGDLKISDAPVSTSDIPKTIVSELGLNYDYPGCSMFAVKESDIRERRFLEYKWGNDNKPDLSGLKEYIVTGFSWLKKSWRPTYRLFTPEGIKDSRPPVYEYGSEIKFGIGGNAKSYQFDGWSHPEEGFTRTNGKSASLIIPINQPQFDLTLEVILTPFISGEVEKQCVDICINSEKLGEFEITKTDKIKMVIPKKYITDSLLNITFNLPNAVSPYSLNIGDDTRILGIAVGSIIISEPNVYEYGSQIKFGNEGNAKQYQGQGWSAPENNLTWTDGKSASLVIPVSQPQSDLILNTTVLFPFVVGDLVNQKVNVYTSGNKLGEWDISSGGNYMIKIPKNYITNNLLEIMFELPNAVSPMELNVSNDKRTLGIAVQSISLSEKN